MSVKQLLLGEETGLGTGASLWPSAIVTIKYLEKRFSNGMWGTRVLELGCGTGAVGLACAKFGAQVVLTEQEQLAPLIKTNIELVLDQNDAKRVSHQPFDWAEKDLTAQERFGDIPFEFVIASDCVEPKLYPPLLFFQCIDYLCWSTRTEAIVTIEYRLVNVAAIVQVGLMPNR